MDEREALASYKDFVVKNPTDRDGARKSFYDTFGKDPELMGFAKEKSAFQREASRRKADIGVAQTRANFETDIADARTTATKTLAAAIPAAASLFTGGATAPMAMAMMGGVGAGTGLISEATALGTGSSQAAKSGTDLVKSLGIDALWGTLGEGAGRAVLGTAKLIGPKLWRPLVAKAAAKYEEGQKLLDSHGTTLLNKLRDVYDTAGKPTVDIGNELAKFTTEIGKRKTGPSKAFKELWENELLPKMQIATGGVVDKQPLAHMVEIQELASSGAWKRAGLNYEERTHLRNLAGAMRDKIASGFEAAGGKEARALYEDLKFTRSQVASNSAAADLAKNAAHSLLWRLGYHSAGAGLGGAYGYHKGGVTGAALGAVGGAAASTALNAIPAKLAPIMLERIFANDLAAKTATRAIKLLENGDAKLAAAMMTKAAVQSGAADSLKGAVKDMALEPGQ